MKQVIEVIIEKEIEEQLEIDFVKENPEKVAKINEGIEEAVKTYMSNMLQLPKEIIQVKIKVVE